MKFYMDELTSNVYLVHNRVKDRTLDIHYHTYDSIGHLFENEKFATISYSPSENRKDHFTIIITSLSKYLIFVFSESISYYDIDANKLIANANYNDCKFRKLYQIANTNDLLITMQNESTNQVTLVYIELFKQNDYVELKTIEKSFETFNVASKVEKHYLIVAFDVYDLNAVKKNRKFELLFRLDFQAINQLFFTSDLRYLIAKQTNSLKVTQIMKILRMKDGKVIGSIPKYIFPNFQELIASDKYIMLKANAQLQTLMIVDSEEDDHMERIDELENREM